MKHLVLLIFGILCLYSTQLHAKPQGRYERACSSCAVEGDRFCCQCKDGYGGVWKRCIDKRCKRAALIDGFLRCSRRISGWPRGSYQRGCAGCKLQGDRFCCQCKGKPGDWSKSCIDKRCKRAVNRGGRLWCATRLPGWPGGSYRYYSRRCGGCYAKGGQFCCTCMFTPVDSRPRAIKSCVPSSCKRVSALYGHLRCRKRPKSWPKGRYYRRCSGCRQEGDEFCCICKQHDGETHRSCIARTCQKVTVVHGRLQCAQRPKSWPKGRFYRACSDCRTKGDRFCCLCQNKEYKAHHTCISKQCKRASLRDGLLRCSRRPKSWPTGNYRYACVECRLNAGRFCCTCKTKEDMWRRSCVDSRCKSASAIKGLLRCRQPLKDWPKGNFRGRCFACRFSGDKFCCRCRGRYGWRRNCIAKSCKEATTMYGALRCKAPLASWPKGDFASACRGCLAEGDRFCCHCKHKDDLGRMTFRKSCVSQQCKRASNANGTLLCAR